MYTIKYIERKNLYHIMGIRSVMFPTTSSKAHTLSILCENHIPTEGLHMDTVFFLSSTHNAAKLTIRYASNRMGLSSLKLSAFENHLLRVLWRHSVQRDLRISHLPVVRRNSELHVLMLQYEGAHRKKLTSLILLIPNLNSCFARSADQLNRNEQQHSP